MPAHVFPTRRSRPVPLGGLDARERRRVELERRRHLISTFLDYAIGVVAAVLASVFTSLMKGFVGLPLPFLLYFPAVIAAAWYRGYRSGLTACGLAVVFAFLGAPPAWNPSSLFVPTFFAFALFGVSLLFIAAICGQLQLARRNLEYEKERYRTTVGSVADAVIATELDGRIRTMNAQAEQMTGWSAREAQGRPFFTVARLVDEHSRKQVADPVQAVLQARRPVSFGNHTLLLARDGREIYVEDSAAPIFARTEEPSIEGVVVVVRDVSESRHAAEALATHARDLETRVTERTRELKVALSDMETFSYSVSHDLRAPLRAIRMYADVLREDYGDKLDAAAHDYLTRIERGADRLDRMTSDLLDYARLPAADVELEAVDLNVLVGEAVAALRQQGPPELLVSIEEPLPWVIAHEAVLQQAIRNLLENAGKFVVSGRPPLIHISTVVMGTLVRLNVRDNGVGISPEDRQRVFHLFDRLHARHYPGTGIGLAIAQRAVEKCGGTIGFDSAPGEGSTFWIDLPICAPREATLPAHRVSDSTRAEPTCHPDAGVHRTLDSARPATQVQMAGGMPV